MPRRHRPPPWVPLRSILILAAAVRSSHAAFIHHRRLPPQERLLPHAAAAGHDNAAPGPPPPSPPKLLVLFKGGPAGNADRGTSLACLREAEFRGLARSFLGAGADGLSFVGALETDLSLAAGSSPGGGPVSVAGRTAVDEGDDEEEEEEDSSSSGGGGGASSLQWVHGHGMADDAEALRRVASRAVLVHAAYEVWGEGTTYEVCAAAANGMADADPRLAPFLAGKGKRWAARCLVFGAACGRRKSLTDLPQKLEAFRPLLKRLPGPVDLKRPELQLALLEDGDAAQGEPLHRVFFARELCRGAHGKTQKLSLKRRGYVTTTSMDARTSLVMANVAGLREGDRVLDPFAGSGGLLLAAAEMGAGVTVGVDVNCTIDLGKVTANFEAQGLAPPARYLFGDAASPEIQAELMGGGLGPFDVIVADPPYGKREKGAARAEGAAQEAVATLVGMAASPLLRAGGRAVFFVPAHPSCPDIVPWLPSHPCVALLEAARQPLNANLDRWLIALEKGREARPGETVQSPVEMGWAGAGLDGEEGEEAAGGALGALRIWHYRPPPSPSIDGAAE